MKTLAEKFTGVESHLWLLTLTHSPADDSEVCCLACMLNWQSQLNVELGKISCVWREHWEAYRLPYSVRLPQDQQDQQAPAECVQ